MDDLYNAIGKIVGSMALQGLIECASGPIGKMGMLMLASRGVGEVSRIN